jgi:hypothetical protein
MEVDLMHPVQTTKRFEQYLRNFRAFGTATQITDTCGVSTYTNEFWTAKQRAAHSLHELSYRACFKSQLPRFFIEQLTQVGDAVYDPFMGRGTTLLEAALCGRRAIGCDINPLSTALIEPRLNPPTLAEVEQRLHSIALAYSEEIPKDLLVFFHPATLREICALRQHCLKQDQLDTVDQWIRMVALNRLTGHSPGFFSVYTLPPNQAVSVESQRKINLRRAQTPPRRHVRDLVQKKSRKLLGDVTAHERQALRVLCDQHVLITGDSTHTPAIANASVALVVTSPPFLDVVQYAVDNWLRCWFIGVDAAQVPITMLSNLSAWQAHMTQLFHELHRVLRPGGHVAFEVGEVRGGKVKLEEAVIPCAQAAGLQPVLVLINQQVFTKTSKVWGVHNNTKGTNTNRIVLLRKSA